MTGLFVVFEGGDSAGKTTQSELLCGWLKARGRAFVATRQPGGTEVGSHLRRLVLDPSFGDVSPRAEALMYAADKAQHVHELIAPALARGEVVVSDRYVESMVAYQGAGRGLGTEEIARIAWWAVDGLHPDLTVVLDVHPDDVVPGIHRARGRHRGVHRRGPWRSTRSPRRTPVPRSRPHQAPASVKRIRERLQNNNCSRALNRYRPEP